MTDYLMIGEVLKPQGLRGECKIRSYAAEIGLFSGWKTLYLQDRDVFSPLPFSFRRVQDSFVYGILGDCASPEDVERLRGKPLYIDRAHAAPLPEEGNYIADLLGCEAVDERGQVLGVLKDVLQYGSVDTWVFSGPRAFMAPALKSVFPRVDPEGRRIHVLSGALEEVAVFED